MIKACFVCIPALWLLGCSTPQPPLESALAPVPPPEISIDLPLEPPARVDGAVCKLGESCLALDPRPFEACLVDTKRCVDKGVQTVPAQGHDAPPPASLPVGRR